MNRREHPRYTIWFPVTLEEGSREVWAICRDASRRGIRISSSTALEVGTRVSVAFRVAPDDEREEVVHGRVVRIDAATRAGQTWPHDMAIQFDEVIPQLESQLQRHSSRPPPADE